jgi:hypothetical protein
MGIDERIAALEANIALVRATAVVHGVNIESLHSSVAELHASMAELQVTSAKENESLRQNLRELYSSSVQQGENIGKLAAQLVRGR